MTESAIIANQQSAFGRRLTTGCLLALSVCLTLSLAGCSATDPTGTPSAGLPPAGMPPQGPPRPTVATPAAKPAAGPEMPKKPSAALPGLAANPTQDKPKFALATEILDAGANPFLIKLPKIVVAQTDPNAGGGTAAPEPVVVNPFDGLRLLGIVYSSGKSMALLAGAESAQMVRAGAEIVNGTSIVKIAKIGADFIELSATQPTPQKQTLYLPNIVGFGREDATGTSTDETGMPSLQEPGSAPPGAGASEMAPNDKGSVVKLPDLKAPKLQE